MHNHQTAALNTTANITAYTVTFLIVILFGNFSYAGDPCFQRDSTLAPLRQTLTIPNDLKTTASQSGLDENTKIAWAEYLTTVPVSIDELILEVKKIEHFKNLKKQDVTTNTTIESWPKQIWGQTVSIHMTVALFISVDWVEQHRLFLLDGSVSTPKKVLYQYQKTDGTSHIKRLCGSILMTALPPNSNDKTEHKAVSLVHYAEEANAPSRPHNDVLAGIQDTVQKLAKLPSKL
jgi:hypothetical protein